MIWRVDRRKLLDYLLSESSEPGEAKNRFFRAVGFDPNAWMVLRDALAEHPITAFLTHIDNSSIYGEKRIYECRLASPDGTNPCVRTVWQRCGKDYRLVTAYPFL